MPFSLLGARCKVVQGGEMRGECEAGEAKDDGKEDGNEDEADEEEDEEQLLETSMRGLRRSCCLL